MIVMNGTGAIGYSNDGLTWTLAYNGNYSYGFPTWSHELSMFSIGARVSSPNPCYSYDGINITKTNSGYPASTYIGEIWIPELGQFVSYNQNGQFTSTPDGINWTSLTSSITSAVIGTAIWIPEYSSFIMLSNNGQTGYISGYEQNFGYQQGGNRNFNALSLYSTGYFNGGISGSSGYFSGNVLANRFYVQNGYWSTDTGNNVFISCANNTGGTIDSRPWGGATTSQVYISSNATTINSTGGLVVYGGISGGTGTFSGKFTVGGTGYFNGGVTGSTAYFQSLSTSSLSMNSGNIGYLSGSGYTGATGFYSGLLTVAGGISGSTGYFDNLTIDNGTIENLQVLVGGVWTPVLNGISPLTGSTGYFSGLLTCNGGITSTTGYFSGLLTCTGGITSSTGYFSNLYSSIITGGSGYFNNLTTFWRKFRNNNL